MAAAFNNLIATDSHCWVNGIFYIGLFTSQNGGTENMPSDDEHGPLAGLAGKNQRLGWLAHRTAGAEGFWRLTEMEGEVPQNLTGTLYRICPGQKENHGVALRHLFDGDAFICGYSFLDGQVTLRARFVETPQRQEERKAGRMLYPEFGTISPPAPEGWMPVPGGKNQPSVNVIPWDGHLLGLSEGGHPTAIDPQTLAYQGPWNFHGTLAADIPFTAHPRFDPETGEGFGFGIRKGPGLALTVFRMETNGKLTQLYSLPQKGYFMVHDMLLTKEHIVFVIPPLRFDLSILFSGKAVPADALRYYPEEPMRIVILTRSGITDPVTIEWPAHVVFHHGNAFLQDGKIVMDSILSPDTKVLEAIYPWKEEYFQQAYKTQVSRFVLDPIHGKVESHSVLATHQEFPRFDLRRCGRDLRFLYTLEFKDPRDPMAAGSFARHDLHRRRMESVEPGKGRALSEVIFVPHPGKDEENRGWLLMQGYDAFRDENYLEIRDAGLLNFIARIWTGQHFPLGFHGNFCSSSLVSPGS
jgi:all-trans-8'-apo-beta-carotenal 15,15'-oxygenase